MKQCWNSLIWCHLPGTAILLLTAHDWVDKLTKDKVCQIASKVAPSDPASWCACLTPSRSLQHCFQKPRHRSSLKRPSTEVHKEPVVPMHNEMLQQAWKWNNAACSHMDGPQRWSHLLIRERQISLHLHMWNLLFKVMQINLFTKQKRTQKSQKQTCGYPRKAGVRDKSEVPELTYMH